MKPYAKGIKLADLVDEVEEDLTPSEKRVIKRDEARGIRTYACPECGNAYTGKHIAGIIVCGRCGWRRPGSKRNNKK